MIYMGRMMWQTCSMNSSAFDFQEIARTVAVFPDRVVKTIGYSGEPLKIESALAAVKQRFYEIQILEKITTVRSLQIKTCGLEVRQERVKSQSNAKMDDVMSFVYDVMQANHLGWIFGDLNYKNVIFDGVRFRTIDFEPFTKVKRESQIQYRVTPPYFHPLDVANKHVSCLTDRLGLIGLYLRIRLGLRKQKEIFSLHADGLHGLALKEGESFVENLKDLGEKYA